MKKPVVGVGIVGLAFYLFAHNPSSQDAFIKHRTEAVQAEVPSTIQMAASESIAETKVIMLTADDQLDNIFKAEDKGIGAYHFLGKPFDISELQALVLDLSLPIKN